MYSFTKDEQILIDINYEGYLRQISNANVDETDSDV
jgi:hypothetical protein